MARRKKDCGARQCSTRIKAHHYFCESCMLNIPKDLRQAFYEAYRIADGKRLIVLSTQIRNFLEQKYFEKHYKSTPLLEKKD